MKIPAAIANILATLFDGIAAAFGAASKGATWVAYKLRESAQ